VDIQTYADIDDDGVPCALASSSNGGVEKEPNRKPFRNRFATPSAPPALDFDSLFPNLPAGTFVALEIGFGLGDSLVEMATRDPRGKFLGAEVHRPGIGAALLKLKEKNIENVRLVRMDALWLLRDFVPDGSLSDVCVYFPDPWSDHQAHRRIVSPFLLKLCARKMKRRVVSRGANEDHRGDPPKRRNARLHVSTDDAAYATHVRHVFADAVDSGIWRAVDVDRREESYGRDVMLGRTRATKYESKGEMEGRLVFEACVELEDAELEVDSETRAGEKQ
jgi:tRNA (guanine-N7-)-methyltransferase